MLKKLIIVIVFSIAFAYIEAAVVVYLRQIFYTAGFDFPLTNFPNTAVWQRLFLTEVGREIATIVLIFTCCWLIGENLRQRVAFFLFIFGIWDIFFYVWLKIFLNWPASLMDWDILFLIPVVWAGPVIAPILVSLLLILFAVLLLYRPYEKPVRLIHLDWLGFSFASLAIVVSFCIAGLHITEIEFKSFFYWPLFGLGCLLAMAVFSKSLLKS